MNTYALYKRAQAFPFGNWIFSRAACFMAPYFGSIRPRVESLESGKAVVRFKKRRSVTNHINTVHVIAICNGLELAMGMVTEATIPKHLRWLPKSMSLEYPAKSETKFIKAVATVNLEDFKPDSDVLVNVQAMRDDGTVVVEGTITIWVTEKPKK